MTRTEIEADLREHFEKLNQPKSDFTLDRRPRGDGSPHVEGDGPTYDLVVDADGAEMSRQSVDGYEVAFQIMQRHTRLIAQAEEKRNRQVIAPAWLGAVGGWLPVSVAQSMEWTDYSRATWIESHIRLMDYLRGDWGERTRIEHDRHLKRYPLTKSERAQAKRLDLRRFGLPT